MQSLAPVLLTLPPVGEIPRWHRRLLGAACVTALGIVLVPTLPARRAAEPVAGIPALKYTDEGMLQRRKPGRVVVELDRSLEQIGPKAQDAVMRSFGAWLEAAPTLPDVAFVHSDRDNRGTLLDGKNTVSFAPIEFEGHQRDLGITITYSDDGTGEIIEADIVLNTKHSFELLDDDAEGSSPRDSCGGNDERCHSGYDLESVVTHEVGHFWGLGEDREELQATMFLCTSRCEVHKRTLEDTDVSVLDRLYTGITVTATQSPGCGSSSGTTARWGDD